jgi:hypothetical protein
LWTATGNPIALAQVEGRLEAWVPANVALLLQWDEAEACKPR